MGDSPGRLLYLTIALVVAWPLCVSGVTPTAAHPALSSLPTLRLGYYTGWHTANVPGILAASLDPAHVTNAHDLGVSQLVNANLVRILPDGKVAPDLATPSISQNHRTYTFTIRNNARFSNRHVVTAADAAFSLERALNPSTQSEVADQYDNLIVGADAFFRGKTHSIPGLKVLSRRVLQITITKPVAYFLDALSFPSADVLDPSVVGGKPAGRLENYLTDTCVANQGSGPFEFVCHDGSSTIHSFYAGTSPKYALVPNPFYYGRHPQLRIELPWDPARDLGYRAYRTNRVDTAVAPPLYVQRLKGKKEFHQYPSSFVSFLNPNAHMAPFNNVHCRLALAYAIDRETIANVVQEGTTRATYTIVPKGMLGYYTGANNPHYSLAKSRAELARCPSRTVPFEFKYENVPHTSNRAKAVASMLSRAGLNVRLVGLPHPAWLEDVTHSLDATGTQLILNNWAQDYPDPQDYCSLLLRSGQPEAVSGWSNRQYDRLVDQADVTMNRAARAVLYIRAQHLALSQGALITIDTDVSNQLIEPYVHGLVTTEAYAFAEPRGLDWANVSIGKH